MKKVHVVPQVLTGDLQAVAFFNAQFGDALLLEKPRVVIALASALCVWAFLRHDLM